MVCELEPDARQQTCRTWSRLVLWQSTASRIGPPNVRDGTSSSKLRITVDGVESQQQSTFQPCISPTMRSDVCRTAWRSAAGPSHFRFVAYSRLPWAKPTRQRQPLPMRVARQLQRLVRRRASPRPARLAGPRDTAASSASTLLGRQGGRKRINRERSTPSGHLRIAPGAGTTLKHGKTLANLSWIGL
jgi:hypothetical protein